MVGEARGKVVIAGAGIVGIAAALWLQRDGWAFTLVDPAPPAEAGASAGNAGLIEIHIARPIAMPGIIKRLPAMMLDPLSPPSIKWAYLPSIAPWLVRIVTASRHERVEAIAQALQSELSNAWSAFEPLIKSAKAKRLIRRDGVCAAYPMQAFLDQNRFELDMLQRVGVRLEIISGAELGTGLAISATTIRRASSIWNRGTPWNCSNLPVHCSTTSARKAEFSCSSRLPSFTARTATSSPP